jgi:hypothetical protein
MLNDFTLEMDSEAAGIIDLKRIDKRAVIIATIANNVARNHSFLNVCFTCTSCTWFVNNNMPSCGRQLLIPAAI